MLTVLQLEQAASAQRLVAIFDKDFNLLGLEVGKEASLLSSFQQAVKEYNVPIEQALMSITSNPADILGLDKGRLKATSDADVVLLDKATR